jgi:hypothetical protein
VLFLSTYIGGKEGTRLRREVGIPYVTSHQRLKILEVCAFFEAGAAFEQRIQAKSKYNKGSDVPFMVRLRSIYGPLTVGDMGRVIAHHQVVTLRREV